MVRRNRTIRITPDMIVRYGSRRGNPEERVMRSILESVVGMEFSFGVKYDAEKRLGTAEIDGLYQFEIEPFEPPLSETEMNYFPWQKMYRLRGWFLKNGDRAAEPSIKRLYGENGAGRSGTMVSNEWYARAKESARNHETVTLKFVTTQRRTAYAEQSRAEQQKRYEAMGL